MNDAIYKVWKTLSCLVCLSCKYINSSLALYRFISCEMDFYVVSVVEFCDLRVTRNAGIKKFQFFITVYLYKRFKEDLFCVDFIKGLEFVLNFAKRL